MDSSPPSSPQPGPSSRGHDIFFDEMAFSPPRSPQPGTSSQGDHICEQLAAFMSPRYIDMSAPEVDIGDEELYGILTGTADTVIDEWANVPQDDEYFMAEELPPNVEQGEDTIQPDQDPIGTDSPSENSTLWYPGNSSSLPDIPFTGVPGILPHHVMDGKSPLDFLFLFLNQRIVDLILECTNKYGNKLKAAARSSRARFNNWKDVTIAEFQTFLGIIFLMGTIKLNRMNEYWSTHYLLRLSPRFFMSRDRFYLILRALNVQEHDKNESIFKIKSLIDLFNQTTNSVYYPEKQIAIDESLILWKGRLSFRQYIKGKTHRYGIKLYILADLSGIILKIHLYAGSRDTVVGGRNHVKKVVMLLMEKYMQKGHSLYIDNFYTSVGLAEELIEKNTYVTGTLRANRVGNPLQLIKTKLKPGEACIMHNKNNIIVTKWQDKREVFLLSSEHKSDFKATTSRRSRTVKYKPAVQIEYNKYMRAVDRHDQLLSYYCCEHKTIRWYKKVIIHIIQICLINGYLLYNKQNQAKVALHDFRKSIIESLLPQPDILELARPISHGKIHLPKMFPLKGRRTTRKRCKVCYINGRRVDVTYGCSDCPGFPGLCIDPCFRQFHKY